MVRQPTSIFGVGPTLPPRSTSVAKQTYRSFGLRGGRAFFPRVCSKSNRIRPKPLLGLLKADHKRGQGRNTAAGRENQLQPKCGRCSLKKSAYRVLVQLDLSMPQYDLNFLQNFLHLQRIQRQPERQHSQWGARVSAAEPKPFAEAASVLSSFGSSAQSLKRQGSFASTPTYWAPRLDAARSELLSFYLCSFAPKQGRRTA